MKSKLVFFNHSYLTPIRHGIQAGHAAVHLVRKYEGDKEVTEWADNYETFVILDGGVTPELKRIRKLIPKELKFAQFREPDCGNMVTSIAVLIPDDWKPKLKQRGRKFFDTWKSKPLAK